jgi:flagellar hook protein FlgE
MTKFSAGEVVRLVGDFSSQDSVLNGRKLTVLEVDSTAKTIKINTTGEGFPDSAFTLTQSTSTAETTNFSEAYVLSDPATDVEAFFEGADLAPTGAVDSYNNQKIILRETASSKHAYKHGDTDLNSIAMTAKADNGFYMVTSLGTTNWAALAKAPDSTTAFAPIVGSVFQASANNPTAATTGRVTEVYANTDLSTIGAGQVT